jgi:hypothetical protein
MMSGMQSIEERRLAASVDELLAERGLGWPERVPLFGWEKAYGDDAELSWWCDAAREGARFL